MAELPDFLRSFSHLSKSIATCSALPVSLSEVSLEAFSALFEGTKNKI
jgi:hypothetical protein